MTKADVLQQIQAVGLVPVLRADSEELAWSLATAIAAGGVNVLEVTMTIPGALQVMRRISKERPDILFGAGTVLDPLMALRCIQEGAQFIVSPALNVHTIHLCQQHSIAIIPGALTPTEIAIAWQEGADVIKIFPADSMGGARYLKSLKAPFPQIKLLPTGGITLDTAKDFLDAGAFALGIGADLADLQAIKVGDAHSITQKALAYLEIVQTYRQSHLPGQ